MKILTWSVCCVSGFCRGQSAVLWSLSCCFPSRMFEYGNASGQLVLQWLQSWEEASYKGHTVGQMGTLQVRTQHCFLLTLQLRATPHLPLFEFYETWSCSLGGGLQKSVWPKTFQITSWGWNMKLGSFQCSSLVPKTLCGRIRPEFSPTWRVTLTT